MSSKVLERRIVDANIELRKAPDGSTVGVRGYAAVFDSEAHGEVIRSSAFNRTIAQQDNIRLLVNHEGVPLASTRSGTMKVGIDERGQWFDAELDMSNPDAQRLVSALERGDIYQCSFAGYFHDAPEVDGLREVREVQLVDNSIVTYPWYEATEVSLTGDRQGDVALACLRSLDPHKREEVLALLDERDDHTDFLDDADPNADPDEPAVAEQDVERDADEVPAVPAMTTAEARKLLGLAD